MITQIKHEIFDTCLTFSDWRYAAAAVGIMRMCAHSEIVYEKGFGGDEACICYKRSEVVGKEAEKRFLAFAEHWFQEFMHHSELISLLERDDLSEEQFARAREKTKANAVAKKVFKDLPALEKENFSLYGDAIKENRDLLIMETFRNGKNMYAKFCNTALLLTEKGKICRLNGYYVDTGRKTKSISFRWDPSSYVYADEPEFDYIPFGFSRPKLPKVSSSFFINNNFSARQLLASNEQLDQNIMQGEGARASMFAQTQDALHYIDYDVEVLAKAIDDEFFTNMYVRKMASVIFRLLGNNYRALTFPCQLNEEWIDIEELVTDAIINDLRLDPLLDSLLRAQELRCHNRLVETLIFINSYIFNGGEIMSENKKEEKLKDSMEQMKKLTDPKLVEASRTAYWVKKSIQSSHRTNAINQAARGSAVDPKVKSYQQKLIACLTAHDYDRFCEILLQLSAYSGVTFGFANHLFENFERNKNIAYTFVNALGQSDYNSESKPNTAENNEER